MFKNSTYLIRFLKRSKQVKLICLLMMSFSLIMAQDRQISGTVTDADNGESIPGVNILIKGTTQGTVTDAGGAYSIVAPSGSTLVFSSVGFVTQEVSVGNQSTINIGLASDVQSLQEVVVTGYSVDTRRETTGSVATVDPKDLTVQPSGNIEQQLQGRVAGVTVISNGQPGTTSQVRVRGYGALGGNAPLYIVDGVPQESVEFLSPDDIESTTVLKDATAASIYGARAAGGVIVYTTKQGKKGKQNMQVTYNGMIGVTNPGDPDTKLNPQQQAEWTWNAIRNAATQAGETPTFSHPQYGTGQTPVLPDWLLVGSNSGIVGSIDLAAEEMNYNTDFDAGPIYLVIPANQSGTDWFDAITQNGILHRHNIGLSGGGEGNRFYVGLSMQDQEGIIKRQKFERYTARVNSEFDLAGGVVRIGENIQATYRGVRQLLGGGGGSGSSDDENLILTASRMSPIIPIFDQFGGYAGTAAPGFNNARNPVATIDGDANDRNFTVAVFGNVYAEVEPIEDLVVRTSFGGRYLNFNSLNYTRRQYENSENNSAFSFGQANGYVTEWVWTNTIAYEREFGDHKVGILAGQEALNFGTVRQVSASGINPFAETTDFINLSTVENRVVNGFNSNGVNFSSYFGRLTYDFQDRYLATVVVRNDGSSRFGSENRRGTFPAFSVGWRLSEEAFLSGVNWIDDLKLRGGWGQMGNSNNVDPNNQFSLYGTSINQSSYDIGGGNGSAATGFYRTRIGNPAAQWETSETINIGIDGLLWDGKVDFVLDFWQRDTEDLLFVQPVTTQNGFRASAPSVNVGEMRNKGVDLKVKVYGNLSSEVTYELTINGGLLDNEIVALAEGINDLPNRSSSYRGITPVLNQVGQPLSNFFGYQTDGLFASQAEVDAHATQEGAAPGRFRFRDINGDGVINTDDRTSIGNPIPDFQGGITFKVGWRNFDLEMYGFASLGNEIYNVSKLFTDFYPLFPGAAISARVLDSWTFENPTGEIPIFENVSNFSTITQSNSYYVEDGSYFRLQNLTVGYNIPVATLDRWGMTKFRIFASVNNLFTISGYNGLDPSVGGNADTNFGIDLGNVPITRSWTAGVNIAF